MICHSYVSFAVTNLFPKTFHVDLRFNFFSGLLVCPRYSRHLQSLHVQTHQGGPTVWSDQKMDMEWPGMAKRRFMEFHGNIGHGNLKRSRSICRPIVGYITMYRHGIESVRMRLQWNHWKWAYSYYIKLGLVMIYKYMYTDTWFTSKKAVPNLWRMIIPRHHLFSPASHDPLHDWWKIPAIGSWKTTHLWSNKLVRPPPSRRKRWGTRNDGFSHWSPVGLGW